MAALAAKQSSPLISQRGAIVINIVISVSWGIALDTRIVVRGGHPYSGKGDFDLLWVGLYGALSKKYIIRSAIHFA